MQSPYAYLTDLAKEIQPPEKGILSRTLFHDDRLKVVLFGFAQGEELSEYAASLPGILHFLQGEARWTLDNDVSEARTGAWIYMSKGLRHSIQARTPVVMLPLVLKEVSSSAMFSEIQLEITFSG
jgi:quercetin dioxygenase-like cupin family protein